MGTPSVPGAPCGGGCGCGGEVQEASGMTLTDGSSRWCSRLSGDDDGLKMVSPGRGWERCFTRGRSADPVGVGSAEDRGWKSGDPIPPWG